jgi:hypothetical protein
MIRIRKFDWQAEHLREAEIAVFHRVPARIFTLPCLQHFRSSTPMPPTFWDGTDPVIRGHRAAPGGARRRGQT